MRLFITEFISGGGLANHPLPAGLKQEGLLMLQSLIDDCLRIQGCHVLTTLDSRIQLKNTSIEHNHIDDSRNYLQQVLTLAKNADLTWVIAPESEGMLVSIIDSLTKQEIQTLNCDVKSILISGDKLVCAEGMQAAGIPTPDVIAQNDLQTYPDRVVVKPRYGVGSEDLQIYENGKEALLAIKEYEKWIVQPYVQGEHRSMSLLCWQGEAKILACNIQELVGFPKLRLAKCIVNAFSITTELELLAQKIAQALPGLRGYVGVDFIVSGNENMVVDINPRLTTSYIGLSKALNHNPAQLCIDVGMNNALPDRIDVTKQSVEVVIV